MDLYQSNRVFRQILVLQMKILVVLFCDAQNSVDNHLDKELHRFWDLKSLGISEVEKSPFEDFSDTIYLNKERRCEEIYRLRNHTHCYMIILTYVRKDC